MKSMLQVNLSPVNDPQGLGRWRHHYQVISVATAG